MLRRRSQPKALSEILKKALDKWKLTKPIKRHEVLEKWESVAGPQLAARSRAVRFQGGNLLVEVDHPAWIQELNFLKPKLLEKIAKFFPESQVKGLRFILR